MSETRVMTNFLPPPSQWGSGGFKQYASTARFDQDVEVVRSTELLGSQGTAGARRPRFSDLIAAAVEFDDQVLSGGDGDLLSPRTYAPHRNSLATASLVASVLGLFTGVGFILGIVMGHATLRRIGPEGWDCRNNPAEHRARNALWVGYLGLVAGLVFALFVTSWAMIGAMP